MEACIRSNTFNGHPVLKGETPATVVSGETADISEFADHGLYDWIKFRDTIMAYPDSRMVLGRYLGPSIDIGPVISAKILKETGYVVNCASFSALAQNELDDPREKEARVAFDDRVAKTFGSKSSVEDFDIEFSMETTELY